MIMLPIITTLLFIFMSSFLRGKLAKSIATLCPPVVLLTYFFAVEWKPFDMMFEQKFDWLRIMSVEMGIGLAVNSVNSLLLMTLLLVVSIFSLLRLKDTQYPKFSQSISILFLLTGILSTEIITFFVSWLMLGAMIFAEGRKHLHGEKRISKFSYVGMDSFLMFSGLLLLSVGCSSTNFDVINEKFKYVILEEGAIVYWGFFSVSLAIIIRSSLFPFLFDYRKDIVAIDPSMHSFRLLNMIPLSCILMIKINQAMTISFFSNVFLILGLMTSFIMLFAALTRNTVAEMMNLETGSMLGIIYALLGLGQASISLILLVTFLLLKSSMSMIFSTISNEQTQKEAFPLMILLAGAYVGIPCLTNFFPFLDAAWAFWNEKASLYIYIFFILNGILYVKLLSTIFDFRKISFTGIFSGKLFGKFFIVSFPGFISLLMIFYCLPPNFASINPQILKRKISAHLGDSGILSGSMQEQNIVMIILFLSIIVGILLGVYFYVLGNKLPFSIAIKKYSEYINKIVNHEWSLGNALKTLLSKDGNVRQFQMEVQDLKGAKILSIRIEKMTNHFRKRALKRTNVLLVQTFAMMGICLMIFLLGLGWKNFI